MIEAKVNTPESFGILIKPIPSAKSVTFPEVVENVPVKLILPAEPVAVLRLTAPPDVNDDKPVILPVETTVTPPLPAERAPSKVF